MYPILKEIRKTKKNYLQPWLVLCDFLARGVIGFGDDGSGDDDDDDGCNRA